MRALVCGLALAGLQLLATPWSRPKEDKVAQLLVQAADLQRREPRKGLDLAREASELAKRQGDEARQVEAECLVSALLLDLGHVQETAIKLEGLKVQARQLNEPRVKALVAKLEGQYLEKMGSYQLALQAFDLAFAGFQAVKDDRRMAESLIGLGLVYFRLERPDDASKFWEQAREIYQKLGDGPGEARTLNNLGVLAKNRGEFSKALDYYRRAETIQSQARNTNALADLANNMANLAALMKDAKAAVTYHLRALALRETLEDKARIADSCFNLAELYLKDQQPALARPYLERATKLAQETAYRSLLIDLKELESMALEQAGDLRGALEHYKGFHQARKALTSEEVAKKASEMRERFETDRQAKQIELLKRDQAVRQARLRMLLGGSFSLLAVLVLLAARYRLKVRTTRKIEAQNHDLDEANQRLEQANVFKTMFLASTSHELRTPVNAILGLTSLLREGYLAESERRRYLETISHSADGLLHLLNDILDVGKIEAGKLEVEQIPLNLRQVIEEAVWLLAAKAQDKGLALTMDIDESLPPVLVGDPGRIRQMALNLLSNAVKFTQEGSIACGARVIERLENRVTVRLTVQDTGPGIPAPVQAKLFAAYAQGDASTMRKFGGTGLGLYITRQLAHLMGGEVGLESQEGAGSLFWVTLTLAMGEETAPVIAVPASSGHRGYRGRVLVADDNPGNRMVAEAFLRQEGLDVVGVENGQMALEAMAGGAFDLVFLDGRMPVLDGLATAQEVRRLERLGTIRVNRLVALTGQVQPGDRERLLAAGFDAYVAKPLERDELRNVLGQFLAPAEQPQPARKEAITEGDEPETWKVLRQAMGGDTAFQDFLQGFFQDGETRVRRLGQALLGDDRNQLVRDSHDLKSNAATFGFRTLSKLCWELEQAAPQLSPTDLNRLVSQIEVAFREVVGRWGQVP
ncbi:MAG: tetratricopeptide repeat protein [Holophaga sp.]|nr:tetratricopeptide repeat protein [Holophaga sp.]